MAPATRSDQGAAAAGGAGADVEFMGDLVARPYDTRKELEVRRAPGPPRLSSARAARVDAAAAPMRLNA